MRFAASVSLAILALTLSTCTEVINIPPSTTELEGTWKTIGIWDGGSSTGGLVTTIRVHLQNWCSTTEQYLRTGPSGEWQYQQTYPEQCQVFHIDNGFVLKSDTGFYKSVPMNFAIDQAVLSLCPGYILSGTSDTLSASDWEASYLDHYEGPIAQYYHVRLSMSTDTTGLLVHTAGPRTYSDTSHVWVDAVSKRLFVGGPSTIDTVGYSIASKRLYLAFLSQVQRYGKL